MSLSGVVRSRFILRIPRIILVLAGLLVLPGCWVYSVEPLYEENLSHSDPDLTFGQNLVGSWGRIDDSCLWILTIAANQQAYDLKMAPAPECKSEEKTTEYVGHLVKIGNSLFLDIASKSDEVCDLCLPLHTIFLESQENDSLALVPIDRDWLFQAMAEKKVILACLKSHGSLDAVTLTASSRELKDFVRKYAGDKGAFNAGSDLILKFKRR